MAQWSWQQPQGPVSPNRPRCFGDDSRFDVTSRECRGCEYQSSCRDTIYRARNNQYQPPPRAPSVAGPSSYYDPRYTPPPAPAQVIAQNYQPQPVQVPVAVPRQQQAIQQQPQPQTQQAIQQMLQGERYGWLNDPLYYMGQASPPPQRPQMQGEQFFERVIKNVGLSMLESMFFQSFLAVRQMVLPPGQPKKPTHDGEDDTIDVSPK